MDILNKIIEENGSCSWVEETGLDICSRCPIASMRKREDGAFMSCLEATGVLGTELNYYHHEVDERYKKVAEQLLLDESIEELLKEEIDCVDR